MTTYTDSMRSSGAAPPASRNAIRTAIRQAATTVRHIEWFETGEIRGHVVEGDVAYFQVKLKLGFRIEDQ